MDTIGLLQKLYQSVSANPQAAASIEWSDVASCVKQEIEMRAGMFSSEHLSEMEGHLQEISGEMSDAGRECDTLRIGNAFFELIGIMRALPGLDEFEKKQAQALFDSAALRHYREDTTVLIGDSHVNFFSGNELIDYSPIGNNINLCPSANRFSVLYYGACLAYTCNDPDSSTGFYRKTKYLLENFIHPGARIIVSLGEIDLRVHVFRQTEKQQRDYREIVGDILDNYTRFLTSLRNMGYRVYCWGPIASQKDDSPQDPAFPRIGTEIERNMATADFNERLEKLCGDDGIGYLSIFKQMVTEDFRTKGEYLSSDNFHLSQRAMELAEPVLSKAGLI